MWRLGAVAFSVGLVAGVGLGYSWRAEAPAPNIASMLERHRLAVASPAAVPDVPPIFTPVPAPATPTPAPALEPEAAPTATTAPVIPAATAPALQASPAGAPPAATPERPPPVRIELTIATRNRTFEPLQIHGNAGDLVVLTLLPSGERHTFTVDAFGLDAPVPADAAATVSFTVPVDGITPFYCRFHGTPASGMHGLLIFH